MARDLSTAQQTAVAAAHVRACHLIECQFASGTLRLAIAPWNIVSGGNTYQATGDLMTVDPVAESAGSREGLQFTLSGLDPAIITIAATEPYRSRIVRLLRCYFDDDNAVIGTPSVRFIGRITNMQIIESNETCTVAVEVEHYEADLWRAAPLRWNDRDQQRLYPGDLGCQYAEQVVEKTVTWPGREAMKKR